MDPNVVMGFTQCGFPVGYFPWHEFFPILPWVVR